MARRRQRGMSRRQTRTMLLIGAALAFWYFNRQQASDTVALPTGGYVPGGTATYPAAEAPDPYANLYL